jgi:outer membrane murein-binding lipoprotein Lpp
MKKLLLVSTFALSVILLAGCMNKAQENVEAEIIEEENVIVEEQETVEGEIVEEVVEEEVID